MGVSTQAGTDPSLLRRIRERSAATDWSVFVDRYGPSILAWCRGWGLQPADADDVAQTVLLKLFDAMRTFSYDPARSFRAWLKTVAHHAWRDYVEKQRRAVQGSGDSECLQRLLAKESGDDLLRQLDEPFEQELLEEAMARVRERITARTWDVFYRLTFLQQSGRQVADALGIGIGAAYMAKNRVQDMLREEIGRLRAPDLA